MDINDFVIYKESPTIHDKMYLEEQQRSFQQRRFNYVYYCMRAEWFESIERKNKLHNRLIRRFKEWLGGE